MRATISSALLILLVSCSSLDLKLPDKLGIPKKEEPAQVLAIKQKWKQYKSSAFIAPFETKPSVQAPYAAGKLSEEFLEDGLNRTKFVRFLAGLSEDVVLSPELVERGQHGAVLLAKTGFLSHTPQRPKDMDQNFYKLAYKSTSTSNIHQSVGRSSSLSDAVTSFCDDSDPSNIDRVGHRRWVLNPPLKETGFGYASVGGGQAGATYITMQVIGEGCPEVVDIAYVAWPAAGYFPSNMFGPRQAWSISLNPKKYNLARSRPTVELTRMDDGKVWAFTDRDKKKDGKYFNIDRSGMGLPYCIIFRPDGVSDLLFKNQYRVKIGGLVGQDGKPAPIEYEVRFFTLL